MARSTMSMINIASCLLTSVVLGNTRTKLENQGSFEGVWHGTDYYEYEYASADASTYAAATDAKGLISLSTVCIETDTGDQYIEDEDETEAISSSDSSESSDYMEPAEYIESARRLAILGTDSREEEDGNPPVSGIGQWTVCIDHDDCPVLALACCCTGVMIDWRWVLTAGHCIHEGGTGDSGWYSNVHIYPRRTSTYTPDTVYARQLRVWTEWFNDGTDFEYDQGLIELWDSAEVGFTGWGWNSAIAVGWEFSHFGYSQWKLDGSANFDGTMYQTTGDLSQSETLFLATDTTDTTGGNSGGPWYYTTNNIVYASHWGVIGSENYHVRLTEGRFDHFCDLMNHRCGLFYCAPRCSEITSELGCANDECLENCRYCENGIGGSCQCHNNGCNQCDSGYFKIDYDFPCQSCQESFDHCLFCTDFYGCQQCEQGYTLVQDETGCGDDTALPNGDAVKIHYCV